MVGVYFARLVRDYGRARNVTLLTWIAQVSCVALIALLLSVPSMARRVRVLAGREFRIVTPLQGLHIYAAGSSQGVALGYSVWPIQGPGDFQRERFPGRSKFRRGGIVLGSALWPSRGQNPRRRGAADDGARVRQRGECGMRRATRLLSVSPRRSRAPRDASVRCEPSRSLRGKFYRATIGPGLRS